MLFSPSVPLYPDFFPTMYGLMVIGSGHGHELFCSPVPQSWALGLSWLLFIVHHIYYYYYYYYYDFTVHKTKGNMAIKYEIVTECTEGTPVRGAGALGMDRALQRTNNIK